MDQADQQFNFVLSQVNIIPSIYRMAGQNHNGTFKLNLYLITMCSGRYHGFSILKIVQF